MDVSAFSSRWVEFTNQFFELLNSDNWLDTLITYYSESHRAYHNIDHILDCLGEFDEIPGTIENELELQIGIWFHDIIYDPKSNENEVESARIAKKFCENLKMDISSTQLVFDLIVNTSNHNVKSKMAFQYLNDIDLSILGGDEFKISDYEDQIRTEYKWVPLKEYQQKRGEILQNFLDRTYIYSTSYFRTKFEEKARQNINEILQGYMHYTNKS